MGRTRLHFTADLFRTRDNDPPAFLALAVAVAALPCAALFFALPALLALLRGLLSALADQLGELLHPGSVLLAERLRLAAAVIDPRHLAEPQTQAAPELLAGFEATGVKPPVALEPACKPVAHVEPVPVLKPSAAQAILKALGQTEGDHERRGGAGGVRLHPGGGAGAGGSVRVPCGVG